MLLRAHRTLITRTPAGTELTYAADLEFHGLTRLAVPLVAAYLPLLANKTMEQVGDTLDALPS